MMNKFALIASLLVSSSTLAAEYTFPNNGSWYQLLDDSYAEVCNSSDGDCDVPAGHYTQIEFGEGSVIRTSVTVSATAPEDRTTVLNNYIRCENSTECRLETDIAQVLTGVMCSAYDPDTNAILPVATTFTAGGGTETGLCITNTPANIGIVINYVPSEVRF